MTFEEVKEQDNTYFMPTYGRFSAALDRGKNATAWDVEGKEYIDFTSGIGVNALGWGDEQWAAAVAAQAGRMQHMSNLYYSRCPLRWQKNCVRLPVMPGCFSATRARRPTSAPSSWPGSTERKHTARATMKL